MEIMDKKQNALETELLIELKDKINDGEIIVADDLDRHFDEIWARFPFVGSKIDWNQVPDSFTIRIGASDWSETANKFILHVIEQTCLKSSDFVIVLGDSAVDVVLQIATSVLPQSIISIASLPQHTYITNDVKDWCAVISMEGYMDFGFAPKSL
jgi:hypothetical protein